MEITDIIEEIDVVDFISNFVDLEEKSGEYWGLSPFKNERTPSFSVRRETGMWYDFSSGNGGNVYHFVMKFFKCSPSEAYNILKESVGGKILDGCFIPKLAATRICNKFSIKKVSKNKKLNQSKPEDYMSRFEFDESKLQIWIDEGISVDSMKKFDVKYDVISNRIVYPIRNLEGEIVNIGGRTLEPNFKEFGLRKYTYFCSWGDQMAVIYGLYENMNAIKNKGEVIIFEGMKSVLIARSFGYENCAAILTSHLNPAQLKILVGLGVKVVFALDKEVNICTDKHIKRLKSYCNVEYFFDKGNLLNEKDSPVDKGKEAFDTLYESKLRWR